MESALQITSKHQTVGNETVQGLKDFKSQSLTTKAKKGELLVSMTPAIKKALNLTGDDRVESSTENESLKNVIGIYDEKWPEESRAKLLQQIEDERRANLSMSGMKKQMNKH